MRRIYTIRHDVYADELHQHPQNPSRQLTDPLDALNVYLVAKHGHEVDSKGEDWQALDAPERPLAEIQHRGTLSAIMVCGTRTRQDLEVI